MNSGQNHGLVAGEVNLSPPVSGFIPWSGFGYHELRIQDGNVPWRILYAAAGDAIVILDVVSGD